MCRLACELFDDERGFLISAELLLIATLLVIGLVAGLSSVQTAMVAELHDVATAFGNLDQSYAFDGFFGCPTPDGTKSFTAGSAYTDWKDACDDNCGQPYMPCDQLPPTAETPACPHCKDRPVGQVCPHCRKAPFTLERLREGQPRPAKPVAPPVDLKDTAPATAEPAPIKPPVDAPVL